VRPRSAGQGRAGAALCEQGTALRKPEPAERAEQWQGAAGQESGAPGRLLRAAFSQHRPAKPSLQQRRKRSALLSGGQTHSSSLQPSPILTPTEGSPSPKTLSKEHTSLRQLPHGANEESGQLHKPEGAPEQC